MTPHQNFPVTESSQVGAARRAAARLAEDLGYNDVLAARLALVITELGNNLARHATGGQLLISPPDFDGSVQILCVDQGPGIADLERCLSDGYSTAGTPGTGLGAIERLSDEFSIYSRPGRGTVAFARIAGPRRDSGTVNDPQQFEVGAVCLAAPGEIVSGDAWGFHSEGQHAALMVADGLGHGPDAAEASSAALTVFAAEHHLEPSQLLAVAHNALRRTRGAAVAVGRLDADTGRMLFSGAGNIAGRLISGIEDRSLLSQHGTVGLQIRRLQDVTYTWSEHSIVVLHSDGLTTRWSLAEAGGLLACHPAVIAGWLIRDHMRGRDDATVLVVKRR